MDQDVTGENAPKDSNSKPSGGAKTMNGRGNPMGPGFAMKIPSKQPPKSTQSVKKGRPIKTTTNREGQSSNSTAPDLTNTGSSQQKVSRDARRNIKEDKSLPDGNPNRNTNSRDNPGNDHSESPASRMDNGDSNDKRQPPPTLNSEPERNHLTDNLKQLLSIGGDRVSRIMYSRIQLLNISENPSSKHRPECLDKDFNAANGRWDPGTWHSSLTSPTSETATTTTGERIHRLSLSESRDRFTDDSSQGGIILGPQRRSFQDGCHVTNSAALKLSSSKPHLPSPTEPGRHAGRPRLVLRQRSEADYDSSTAPNRERQIESASALRSEEFDWDRRGDRDSRFSRDLSDLRPEPRNRRELPRDLHELRSEYGRDHREGDFRDREREFRDRRFSNSREYGGAGGAGAGGGWYPQRDRREQRYSNTEPEPEWYTDGPTSQFDTIELGGFEGDTPAAAADFSSWGGEIPTDDLDLPGKNEKKKEGEDEKEEVKDKGQKEEESKGKEKTDESESNDSLEKSGDQPSDQDGATPASTEAQNVADDVKLSEMDFNDLLEIPGFSAVVEQILKENPEQLANIDEEKPATESQQGSSSRFSQWFQKDQSVQGGSASGVSTPHEELENLAELAAERGLASPVDVESKQQPQQQSAKTQADIMRLLVQGSKFGGFGSGNISPSLRQDPMDHQQELARKLLLQQMKSGTVMNAAELEAKAGARQSPSQSYGGVDMQNTDAFNKLVASIREKDKIRHHRQQIFAQQQAVLNQFQGKPLNMNIPGGRNPSPEELAAHTRNIFQQALIKKQLEKQKEAYGEKIRQIEQQRREEQLREAIRSADAKMKESKQVNKSLSFTPTSVMRKMQESSEGKMSAMGDDMMGMPGDAEDLASATASFSAKLANKKHAANQLDAMNHQGNDLLSRIYQSAANTQSKTGRNDGATPGLRRNASYPEVLMDSNKMNRSSAFHQPVHRSMASSSMDMSNLNISGDSETARLRSLLSMTNDPNLMKSQTAKPASLKTSGGIAADIYNNNMLKVDNHGGKYDRSSPGGVKTLLETMEKPINDSVDVELKNQHEVALLTQFVLNQNGITEDQLSRLTPQQQLAVVNSVQKHYHLLQRQKQQLAMERKAQKDSSMRMKQGDLPSMNNAKHDIQAAMANKNVPKLDLNDPRFMSHPKPTTSQTPASMGMKFPPQQATIPGMGLQGMIPTTNHQIHPLQLRSILPQQMQFIPPPMARGHPMLPTAFLPPQAHIPGRLMPPHPPNVPLAGPYPAAAFMQMQLYQQQQQQQALFAAAAIQQQRMQAFAAARQQSANKESRGGEFSNPLERWFGPDVLSHSHLPPPQQKTMTLTDIERANQINQKQE